MCECLLQRYGSAVDRGSGCSRPGCGISPLEEVAINHRAARTFTDWETESWRAQTESCAHEDPGERSNDPRRDWPRLAREWPGVSSGGVGQWWPARLGALSVAVHTWDLLKEVTIIFITFNTVWPQVNSRKGTQLYPSTENWIKNLLSVAPFYCIVPNTIEKGMCQGCIFSPCLFNLYHEKRWAGWNTSCNQDSREEYQ